VTLSMSPIAPFDVPPQPGPLQRSSLRREALLRLYRSGYLVLRDLSCEACAEGVELRGRVSSYFLKQVAQVVVSDVPGVRRVVNLIEVVSSESRSGEGREEGVDLCPRNPKELSSSGRTDPPESSQGGA